MIVAVLIDTAVEVQVGTIDHKVMLPEWSECTTTTKPMWISDEVDLLVLPVHVPNRFFIVGDNFCQVLEVEVPAVCFHDHP